MEQKHKLFENRKRRNNAYIYLFYCKNDEKSTKPTSSESAQNENAFIVNIKK